MTTGCEALMRAELKDLLYTKRPHMAEECRIAAEHGDRSENFEYYAAKRALRKFDSRIHYLAKRLENAMVVDPVEQGKIAHGRVLFGCTVTIEDEEGKKKTYSIVGADEYNASTGLVSWISPIGKALLNSKEEDIVTYRAPSGEKELEVVKVEYVPIEAYLNSR